MGFCAVSVVDAAHQIIVEASAHGTGSEQELLIDVVDACALPKGFRRARNFGFLHPNYKRLIAVLHVLLNFAPVQATTECKQRAPILCACCGAVMVIVKTRIPSVCSKATVIPIPLPTEAMP
jgi:hypothetical protein